jgi:hypothetical protein
MTPHEENGMLREYVRQHLEELRRLRPSALGLTRTMLGYYIEDAQTVPARILRCACGAESR